LRGGKREKGGRGLIRLLPDNNVLNGFEKVGQGSHERSAADGRKGIKTLGARKALTKRESSKNYTTTREMRREESGREPLIDNQRLSSFIFG